MSKSPRMADWSRDAKATWRNSRLAAKSLGDQLCDLDVEPDDLLRIARIGFDIRRAPFLIAAPAQDGGCRLRGQRLHGEQDGRDGRQDAHEPAVRLPEAAHAPVGIGRDDWGSPMKHAADSIRSAPCAFRRAT